MVRNFVAVCVFASYWFIYGKIFDPEIGLNFLVSVVMLKILERESLRDRYMIFFGLLLVLSAGSLFEKSLIYFFFFSLSFLILVGDFYQVLNQKIQFKSLLKSFAVIIPCAVILSFFIPRLIHPLAFNSQVYVKGSVGYVPEVSLSELDSLEQNSSVVFQVQLTKKIPSDDLYWRGNTLSSNDGWNWKLNYSDIQSVEETNHLNVEKDLKQDFRLFTTPEFYFALDYPQVIGINDSLIQLNAHTNTLVQKKWSSIQRYQVWSSPKKNPVENKAGRHYLLTSLKKVEKNWIHSQFRSQNFDDLILEIKNYFIKNNFSYSLSPGKTIDLKSFYEKKIGLCSHYSSATALILRTKGIASRLVSGFMGGFYNDYGSFYQITQNDAHVWVEAYVNNQWVRVDPTLWIAPDRIKLNGEAFFEKMSTDSRTSFLSGSSFSFLYDFKMLIQNWDFKFYQWIDQMDYQGQINLISKMGLNRKYLIPLAGLIILLWVMIVFLGQLKIYKKRNHSDSQKLWKLFFTKVKARGEDLEGKSFESMSVIVKNLNPEIQQAWSYLYDWTFKMKEIPVKKIKEMIKRI